MKKIFTLLLLTLTNLAFTQVPNYVPTNNLKGWWPFNGNANDESGNGNNGTVNGATITTDRFSNANSAYSFLNNDILISNQFYNNGWLNSSVSLWFLTNNNNQVMQMIFNTTPHNLEGFSFNHENQPNLLSHWKNENPSTGQWNIFSANPLNYNPVNNLTWYHFLIVKSGNSYSYFVNGVLDKTSVATISPLSQLSELRFGSIGGAEHLNGKLDDIGIWDRALTQTEITTLYTGVLSSESFTNTTNFQLYPNPANDVVQFKSTEMVEKISIYNALGQLVQENKTNGMKGAISIEHLAQGSYFVKINNQNTSYTLLKN